MITHSFLHRHTIVALVLVPLLCFSSKGLVRDIDPHGARVTQEEIIEYSPQFFKWITVGMWPAAVESMWISLLQKMSENQISREGLKEVSQFYDLATELDPLFYELYEQAGVYFSFYQEDGKTAEHFLEKGIQAYYTNAMPLGETFTSRFWNHPYSLYIYLAYAQGFVSMDWIRARDTFLQAAEVPGAPPYLQSMKVWLKKAGSEKELGKRILTLLAQNTKDEKQKIKYLQKLKQWENTP